MANILSKNDNNLLERLKEKAILNRRMHIRYEVEKEIQYVKKERAGKSFKGLIVNISDSGIGLFVFNPLHEGQEIIIKSDEKSLNRRGIVRRCHEMGEKIYKVGLEFILR
jgi:hypothetical protein